MTKLRHDSNTMLEITTFHNSLILSTLSISSHGFAFGFPIRPHTNGDIFFTFIPTEIYSLLINS